MGRHQSSSHRLKTLARLLSASTFASRMRRRFCRLRPLSFTPLPRDHAVLQRSVASACQSRSMRVGSGLTGAEPYHRCGFGAEPYHSIVATIPDHPIGHPIAEVDVCWATQVKWVHETRLCSLLARGLSSLVPSASLPAALWFPPDLRASRVSCQCSL